MAEERVLLITAGPTHEPIDAVRYLANRSSGRLGIALAAAGRAAGWRVVLLLGPTVLKPPDGVEVACFSSSAELAALLDDRFPACDVLIMAAAVADYRPRHVVDRKLARTGERLVLELEPTPDLLAACAARKSETQRIVGFALEEAAALPERARAKLVQKQVDAIVANPLETMDAADIRAAVFTASGEALRPPGGEAGISKDAFARWLVGQLDAITGRGLA